MMKKIAVLCVFMLAMIACAVVNAALPVDVGGRDVRGPLMLSGTSAGTGTIRTSESLNIYLDTDNNLSADQFNIRNGAGNIIGLFYAHSTGNGWLLGRDDLETGGVAMYGDNTVNGGRWLLYNSAGEDDAVNYWWGTADADFFRMGPDGTNKFSFNNAGDFHTSNSMVAANDVTATDDLIAGDDLTVADDVAIGDDVTIAGNLKLGSGSPSIATGNGELFVQGDLEAGALKVGGAANFGLTLNVEGDILGDAGMVLSGVMQGSGVKATGLAGTGNRMAYLTPLGVLGAYTDGTTSQVMTRLADGTWAPRTPTGGGGDGITALTGDVTGTGPGATAATIAAGAVSLSKMANMATASFIGRNTAGTGVPEVVAATTTARSMMGLATTDSPTFAGVIATTATLKSPADGSGLGTPQIQLWAGGAKQYDFISESFNGTNDVPRLAIRPALHGKPSVLQLIPNWNTGDTAAYEGATLELFGTDYRQHPQDYWVGGIGWDANKNLMIGMKKKGSPNDPTGTGVPELKFIYQDLFQGAEIGLSATTLNPANPATNDTVFSIRPYSTTGGAGITTNYKGSAADRIAFKVDAEGDTFVHDLTTSGTATISGATASTIPWFNASKALASTELSYAASNLTWTALGSQPIFTIQSQDPGACGVIQWKNKKDSGTTPDSGAYLMYLSGLIYDSTSAGYGIAGNIQLMADGTPSNTSKPGRFEFLVTPSGSLTPAIAMQIKNDKTANFNGDVVITTAGKGLKIKTGTNATAGTATLVGGVAVVSTTKTTASSIIMLTGQNSSGTHGELTVSARTAGTSFTISSSNPSDTRLVGWVIIEPAP